MNLLLYPEQEESENENEAVHKPSDKLDVASDESDYEPEDGEAPKKKIGKITKAQIEEIATIKMPDLNAKDMKGAIAIIEGQCRSMGVEVVK